MPQAVTHILLPILLVSFFRDYYLRNKERARFPLHYVMIAGIGGVLPDIDIAVFWLIKNLGFSFVEIHKTFTHGIFFVLILFLLAGVFYKVGIPGLGKHKLKLWIIFILLGLGSLIHLGLDSLTWEGVMLFHPFSDMKFGFNLVGSLFGDLGGLFLATLDGVLLVVWLVYLEWKHKISSFI